MNNIVTIEIGGQVAVGKSTIARIINEALCAQGFLLENIQINCMDGDIYRRSNEQHQQAITSIKNKGLKVVINDNNQRPRVPEITVSSDLYADNVKRI